MQPLINFQDNYVQFDFQNKPGQKIKIVGTFDDPYFCGKDVCAILEYKDVKDALQNHVKPKYKKDLKTILEELEGETPSNSITAISSIEPSYHAGKAVYINEPGLYSLIMKSRTSFAETFQDFVYEQHKSQSCPLICANNKHGLLFSAANLSHTKQMLPNTGKK